MKVETDNFIRKQKKKKGATCLKTGSFYTNFEWNDNVTTTYLRLNLCKHDKDYNKLDSC